MTRVKALLFKLLTGQAAWWVWPGFLLGLAALTLAASLAFAPGPNEWVYIFGKQFGEECGFTVVTGKPCPQCGMTRSFVWAARLDFVKSFFYNPAGLALFVWIQLSGVVGLVRLLTRDPNRLEPNWRFLVGWTLFWTIVLYAIPWLLRVLFDVNPLPTH